MADPEAVREDQAVPVFAHFAPEHMGPAFDTVGGAVQQPGTMRRGLPEGEMHLMRDLERAPAKVSDAASDKMAVITTVVDQTRAWQLLPVEPNRKTALIVALTQPIWVGDETSVNNALGTNYPALAPHCWFLPGFVAQTTYLALKYTSKASLWIASASATPAAVQCMVERYVSGTPVT